MEAFGLAASRVAVFQKLAARRRLAFRSLLLRSSGDRVPVALMACLRIARRRPWFRFYQIGRIAKTGRLSAIRSCRVATCRDRRAIADVECLPQ